MNSVDMILVNTSYTPVSMKVAEVESALGQNLPVRMEQEKVQNALYYFSFGSSMPVRITRSSQQVPGSGRVHAVAGIGNPERFFYTLRSLEFDVITPPFPDHHDFIPFLPSNCGLSSHFELLSCVEAPRHSFLRL